MHSTISLKQQIFSRLILGLLPVLLTSATMAQNGPAMKVLEGTTSPDGKYGVAWVHTGGDQDNFDSTKNYIVNLKSRASLVELPSSHFPNRNHGSLSCLWRKDSAALMVVEGGKWEDLSASVVYLTDPQNEYEPFSDVVIISKALRRGIKSQILKMHPTKSNTIRDFTISSMPKRWTGQNSVLFGIVGQVPKAEDAFVFEGNMALALPGPSIVASTGNNAIPAAPAAGANVTETENIGGIRLNMTEQTLLNIIAKQKRVKVFKGKEQLWEATGDVVQTWLLPEAGLEIDMASAKAGGPKTVLSITCKPPFRGATGQGIRLGASKADVIAAYSKFKTENDGGSLNEKEDTHLVGSIYGGMIFTFKQGRLNNIFFGAAAE